MDIQKEFEMFVKLYQALSAVIPMLSIGEKVKENVIHYLDTAYLWTKEALQAANVIAQQQDQQNQQKPTNAPEIKIEGIEDAKPSSYDVKSEDAD